MILTCPECATRYFVGDDQVAASGRTVKCAACKTRWTAHPEPVLELSSSGEEGAVGVEPAPLSLDPQPLDALPGEELPKVFRAKAQTERRVREAATTGIVWAGMTAFLLVLMGGSFVLREDVVKLWPRSAAAFAAVGFPVNRIGLQIEDIRAEPALQDGHAALSVSGVIRNIRSETVTAPPLQISLVNKQDKRVMAKIAQASDPRVPAGETRHFAVVLLDPPRTAAVVEVAFVTDKGVVGEKPAAAKAPKAKSVSLRGKAEPAPPAHHDIPEATAAPEHGAEAHPPAAEAHH